MRNNKEQGRLGHTKRSTSKMLKRGDLVILVAKTEEETWTKCKDWLDQCTPQLNGSGKQQPPRAKSQYQNRLATLQHAGHLLMMMNEKSPKKELRSEPQKGPVMEKEKP